VKIGHLFLTIAVFIILQLSQHVIADAQLNDHETAFLKRHWPETIPLQGNPPATFSKLEASLEPINCGSCHIQQYRDWQTTLHSKAMGPGLLGQLEEMVDSDPESARMCWRCHTPLAEQQDKLLSKDGWQNNPAFNKQLQLQGLVCAGCHVRNHQRFGPPKKQQPKPSKKINNTLPSNTPDNSPHNGFTAETAFSKSAFCKGCHQFGENDYSLNGKLIENTYNEWLASDYPAKGVQCQTCHMPERRHLWRGIHDPDMVKQGVTINVDTHQTQYNKGDTLDANISIKNSAVGHYFPTYLTPKIKVQAYLADAEGVIAQGTLQQATIGREVTLDLSQELYDTRIPPGETLTINYQQKVISNNMQLHVEITVYPDHFYTRFYESALRYGSTDGENKHIKQALKDSQNSSFILYEKDIPLAANKAVIELERLKPSHISAKPAINVNQKPDWNAKQIQWFDYEEGLKFAKKNNKPIMLIFYADWCPTCHAYKNIFYDTRIVAQAQNMVMIRVNVEQFPKLASRYSDDGGYVPRIYTINKQGLQTNNLFEHRNYPKHFIRAGATNTFLSLMLDTQSISLPTGI